MTGAAGLMSDNPDFSVDLTRAMATFSTPEIYKKSTEIAIPLSVILIPVFHTWVRPT